MSFETITFGRITNSYLNQAVINSTMSNQKKYVDLNLQYSSQKKISTLSDDPMSISTLFGAKNDLSKIEQYLKNISLNTAELNVSETNLASVYDDLTRISDLAIGASNELNGTTEANIVANEIDEVLKHIINVANMNYNGKYIFSGASINTPAYSVSGGEYRYQGTTDAQGYEISAQLNDSTSITLNENGNNIFGEFYTTTLSLGTTVTISYGLLGTVNELLGGLRATPPDYDEIRSKLDEFKAEQGNVTYYRTKVGTNLAVLEKIQNKLSQQKINSENLRSNIEDANIIEVASKMQYQEFALQASLQSATKILQNSLLNFMS